MTNLQLAVRNLFRNRRRSLTTIVAMVIGMLALLLFGGFISSIYYGLQTGIVRSQGHIHIYPKGYLKYGTSRPTEYYIDDYKVLIEVLKNDEAIKEQLAVITPVVRINGIAGNHAADTSKTFFASGVIPSNYNKMQDWDRYKLSLNPQKISLTDSIIDQGVVGYGMAQMLNLCESLKVPECKDQVIIDNNEPVDEGILALQSMVDTEDSSQREKRGRGIQIDLLASTGSGAPNALSLSVIEAQQQGNKMLDDSFINMHFQQAQNLVYADKSRASAIVIQLKNTDSMTDVQSYIQALLDNISLKGQQFEVKNYTEFNPQFFKVISMFSMLFLFIVVVISLVVLFTTINTLTMSVMERITEIGSLRAMGVRRSGILQQFLLEGVVIGVMGATLGIVIAIFITLLFNNAGLEWTPPSNSSSTPLKILLYANPLLLIGTWLLMVFVASISSLIPARFAARMNIVDAIRHG